MCQAFLCRQSMCYPSWVNSDGTRSGWITSVATPYMLVAIMGSKGRIWEGSRYEAVRFRTRTFPTRVRIRTQAYTS